TRHELAVGWSSPATKQGEPGHGRVEIWSTFGRPRLVRRLHGMKGTVQGVAWSPDGKTVAAITGDQIDFSTYAGSLTVWNAASGTQVSSLNRHIDGHQVVFSPEGRTVASTWSDVTVLVDARTGMKTRTIKGQGGALTVAYSPDGTLATGSYAGIVQLWEPRTGKEIGAPTQVVAAPVASLSFDPSGDTFVTTGGSDGVPKLWTTRTLQQLGSDFPGDPGLWLNAEYTPDGKDLV